MKKYTLRSLALLLLLLLSAQPCLSEVILTDEEAQTVQESLTLAEEALKNSEKKSETLEKKMEEQQKLSEEQVTSLKKQLKTAKNERNIFATCSFIEAGILIGILIAPYLL